MAIPFFFPPITRLFILPRRFWARFLFFFISPTRLLHYARCTYYYRRYFFNTSGAMSYPCDTVCYIYDTNVFIFSFFSLSLRRIWYVPIVGTKRTINTDKTLFFPSRRMFLKRFPVNLYPRLSLLAVTMLIVNSHVCNSMFVPKTPDVHNRFSRNFIITRV